MEVSRINGYDIKDKKAIRFYNTINEMKSDTSLKEGMYVVIKGFYSADDKGGAEFIIKSSSENSKKVNLDNGLVAEVKKDNSIVKYIFPKNWNNSLSGDANLIIAYGKSILIDSHRVGNKSALYEMLNKYNVNHIDYFISTHYHDDHVGNFINLINDGYVDNNTNIYLPRYYATLMPEGSQMITFYNDIQTALSNNNLTATTPDELDTIELGFDFKITFYNCETSIFESEGYTDYNNCSTICLVEHNNIKSLYTGDCGDLRRLIDDDLIEDRINLYKIEHHGINTTSNSVYFLRFATPEYAVQPSGMGDDIRNIYSFSGTMSFLKANNTKIYSVHENTEEIEFISENNLIKNITGKENYSNSGGRFIINLYCDSNTTNSKQNGTQSYPYKDLPQALEHILRTKVGEYRIYLADGIYNASEPSSSKNASKIRNVVLTINGNETDNTAVKIKYQTELVDSYVHINNVNFNSNGENSLSVYNSYLKIDNCLFDVEEGTSPKIGIWSTEGSNLVITNSSFAGNNNGISSHDGDIVSVYNCNFTDIIGYYIMANNSVLRETNNTVTNCTYGINYANNGVDITPKYTPRELIYSGAATSGEITLSKAITNFNTLLVIVGSVSGDGLKSAMVLSFGDTNFIKTGKYRFSATSDDIILTVDNQDSTKVTITHSNSGTDGVRKIYGLNMY